MVNWDFYCTGGRNAGKWTKIGVPSCWELQGFGTYQYGMRFYGKATPEGIADEKGKYKYEFTLPQEWEGKQIELVFEAVMTDAKVTINGRKAGNGLHQGGFYRFTYDVSDRIFFGKHKNRLEVEVSKESSNSQVNMAERRADYWNFGGIFRPVFIVAKPAQNIDRVNALSHIWFSYFSLFRRHSPMPEENLYFKHFSGLPVLSQYLPMSHRAVPSVP
jgi:beta-galactosidase/beta-glucuronidase